MAAVEASGLDPLDHFVGAAKVIKTGRWGHQRVKDYRLTRVAAALSSESRRA